MLASIIIRTLNEARHLGDLLQRISQQETDDLDWEVIIVDSGSSDGTLEIARQHHCKILHIRREEFSFGRSLNIGCDAANGEYLVLISGHCVPVNSNWLQELCQPLIDTKVDYSYGRQLGGEDSFYSECRIFAKYFPEQSRIPQDGFYCNNANSALTKKAWQLCQFDEELTGLEDMELALRLTKQGSKIAYTSTAAVFHYHSESWRSIERRFEREAIALQHILPHVQIRKRDLVRYISCSVVMDWRNAWLDKVFISKLGEILAYRVRQYWGSYKGNHNHRKLSIADKEVYFFPTTTPALSNPRSDKSTISDSLDSKINSQ